MATILMMSGPSVFSLSAEIYKYQDENGNWHFTDSPPQQVSARPFDQKGSPWQQDSPKPFDEKKEADPSSEQLLEALSNPQDQTRRYKALEKIIALKDPAMVEGLINILKTNTNRTVRNYAASALGAIGDDRAIDPILDAVKAYTVDQAAYKALGKLGNEKAIPVLYEVYNDRNKPDFYRVTALKAIKKIEESLGISKPRPETASKSRPPRTAQRSECIRIVDRFKMVVPCNWPSGEAKKPPSLFNCPVVEYERIQDKPKNPSAYMDIIVLENRDGKPLDSFLRSRTEGVLRIPKTEVNVSGLEGVKQAYLFDTPRGGYYGYELSAVFSHKQRILYAWGVGVKDFDRNLIPALENTIETLRLK
jgi:hypothetical protein